MMPCSRMESASSARPFFEERGYEVAWEQQELRHGVALTNYRMEKWRT